MAVRRLSQQTSADEAKALLAQARELAKHEPGKPIRVMEAVDPYRKAAAAFDALGDTRSAVDARAELIMSLWIYDPKDTTLSPDIDKLIEGARALSDNAALARGLICRGAIALQAMKRDQAAPDAEGAFELAKGLGAPGLVGEAAVLLCQCAGAGADIPAMAQYVSEAVSRLAVVPPEKADYLGLWALRHLVPFALDTGQPEAALQAALAAVDGAVVLPDPNAWPAGTVQDLGWALRERLPEPLLTQYREHMLEALTKIADPADRARAVAAHAETVVPYTQPIADILLSAWRALPPDAPVDVSITMLSIMARVYHELKQEEASKECLDRLLGLLEKVDEFDVRRNLATHASVAAAGCDQPELAVEIMSRLFESAPPASHADRISCALQLAQWRWNSGIGALTSDPNVPREVTQEAIDRLRAACTADLAKVDADLQVLRYDTAVDALVTNELASSYLYMADEPVRALELATRAERAADDLGDANLAAMLSLTVAYAHHALGADEAAAAAVERHIKSTKPANDCQSIGMLGAFLENGGKSEAALALYDRALSRVPGQWEAEAQATVRFRKAWCLAGLGRADEALAEVERIQGGDWYTSTTAPLLKVGLLVATGDADGAAAAVAGVANSAEALANHALIDGLFDGAPTTKGELRRLGTLLSTIVKGLEVAGSPPKGLAIARLVLAETRCRLADYESAASLGAQAYEGLGPEGDAGLRARALRAQADAADGLGDKAKAEQLRSQAEVLLMVPGLQ
jgi:tetratricopeptide (TPR) repeat protein